ncbi:MAG: hypothetical protein GX638_15825 [Crenarchaeota archaeon]|nr:hypothetical protein [Thermoproteota archaeon]
MDKYLGFKILEIFICLLYGNDCIEVETSHLNKNWRENFIFTGTFEDYIKRYELVNHFWINENKNKTIIRLKNRKTTEEFLLEYIKKYKNSLLSPINGETIDYHSYIRNLIFMYDIFNSKYQESSNKSFTLDSLELRNDELTKGDAKSRFLEYLLDIYFQGFHEKGYLKINWVGFSKIEGLLGEQGFKINISLLKHPEQMFKFLLFMFYSKIENSQNNTLKQELSATDYNHAITILEAYANGAKSKKEVAKIAKLAASTVKDIEEKIRAAYKLETKEQMLIKATQENIIRVNSVF